MIYCNGKKVAMAYFKTTFFHVIRRLSLLFHMLRTNCANRSFWVTGVLQYFSGHLPSCLFLNVRPRSTVINCMNYAVSNRGRVASELENIWQEGVLT
jgi:hypothetical protein